MNLLINEIRAGNKQAFKTLFEKEYFNLVKIAYGYLYDQMASEDIVQESFIYLWENANRIEIKSNIEGYLFTLVKNRCLTTLKSIDITKRCNIYELGLEMQRDDLTEDPEIDKRIFSIWNVVESLPENMQQIVIMRFIQNYRYKEIADELNISVNTVKTQLKRARIKIEGGLSLIPLVLLKIFWLKLILQTVL